MDDQHQSPIAIYDMDRTITRRGTLSGFLIYVLARHRPWRAALLPLTLVACLGYVFRLIDRRQLKAINLALLVGSRFDADRMDQLASGYADRVMRDNIYPAALAQIERDRAEGFRIVLATASFHLYVDAIAQRLGIGDVIATKLEPGRARIIGLNCYGADKRVLIDAWLAEQGVSADPATTRAYSDHVSDAPMFGLSASPTATTPSPKLRQMAQSRGWTIVDWDQT